MGSEMCIRDRCGAVPVLVSEQKTHYGDTHLAGFIPARAVETSEEETVGESGMEGKLIPEEMASLDNKLETCKPMCAEVPLHGLPQLLGKNPPILFDVPIARLNFVVMVLHLWQFCDLLVGMGAMDVHCWSKDRPHVLQSIDRHMRRVFVCRSAPKCSEVGDICEELPRYMAQIPWNMLSDDNTHSKRGAFCSSVKFELNQPCAPYTEGMFRSITMGRWHCLQSPLSVTSCLGGFFLFLAGVLFCY